MSITLVVGGVYKYLGGNFTRSIYKKDDRYSPEISEKIGCLEPNTHFIILSIIEPTDPAANLTLWILANKCSGYLFVHNEIANNEFKQILFES